MYGRPYLDDRSEYDNMARRDRILKDDYFTYKKIPISKTFKKFFRRIDFFAQPITLRHKGEYKFYTNLGAYTSFAIIIIMIGFTTYLTVNMISGLNFTIDTKTISYKNSDMPSIPLGGMGFSPAFALFDDTGKLFNDTKYLSFGMFSKSIDKLTSNATLLNLPINLCKNVGAISQQFDYYFWPKFNNFTLQGTLLNDQYNIIGFSVDKWVNSTTVACATDADINAMLEKLKLKLVFK